jgi:hypothetical protein
VGVGHHLGSVPDALAAHCRANVYCVDTPNYHECVDEKSDVGELGGAVRELFYQFRGAGDGAAYFFLAGGFVGDLLRQIWGELTLSRLPQDPDVRSLVVGVAITADYAIQAWSNKLMWPASHAPYCAIPSPAHQ